MRDKKRVAVAMSGGVDSSVAAALLVERGYEVVGLTMRLLDAEKGTARIPRCCSPEDIHDARRVAAQLDIPAYVVDLREEFRAKVAEYFLSSYLQGETPNPCILCNSELKFRILLRKAMEVGADELATGHYARTDQSASPGRILLRKGIDPIKDQSYFLFNLDQEQLSRIIFPLGEMTKEEVRKKAKKLHLPVAEKAESQDICFVPDGDYRSYFRNRLADRPGPIVDCAGKRVGSHKGIHHFTIGQRKGLGIAHARPLYVLKIDAARNTVVIGEEEDLYKERFFIQKVNWISWEEPPEEFHAAVKVRSAHPGEAARARKYSEDLWEVVFDQAVRGITPGQAAVFYEGDLLLGGGWITISS